MTTGEFEVELGVPASALSGTIQAEAREPGELATRIFDIHDNWEVQVDWTLSGYLSRMICGSWALDVYLESIGPGDELELPQDPDDRDIPLDPTGSGKYSATFHVPADFVKPVPGETDIAYKMVVSLTYKDVGGRPGPLAGFVELPMVQFYQDI